MIWSECDTHIVTFNGPLEITECPLELEVNAEALEALLPQLEKAEEERLQKEATLKKQEAERKKMEPPEDMTVRLLKEVLDDLNITYRSSEKKADLIEKVRRARATLHDDASHDHNMRGHGFPLLSSGKLELRLKIGPVSGEIHYVFITTMTKRNAFSISSSIHCFSWMHLGHTLNSSLYNRLFI